MPDTGAALFDDRARDYDLSAFHYELAEFVASLVPAPAGDVLDVGTGTALTLRALAERADVASLTGVDVSPRMLDVGRSHLPDAMLTVAAAERLPFDAASFDTVLCVAALSYLQHEQATAEWARVLRPGGSALVTAHEADGVTSSRIMREAGRDLGIELPDPNAPTGSPEALQQLAEGAGLRLVAVQPFIDSRPNRLTTASFDLQLSYFGRDLDLSEDQRRQWRGRFSELATGIDVEEQRILIARLVAP